MRHSRFAILLTGALLLLPALAAEAQVNAGDADNNGLVDNHDVLYIGYAFGTAGPRRIEIDMAGDTSQPVSLYWEQHFPTGQNYVFADADGNGIVGWGDFLQVYNNYGLRYHDLRTTDYPPGNPQTDPPLAFRLREADSLITEGSLVQIPLFLGEAGKPVNEFHGLAFSIHFDSAYIRDISLDIDSNSWLRAGEELFTFQNFPPGRESILDVALTRLGRVPASGFGQIGTLSIIIEDDLVDFKPFEKDSILTFIRLDRIELVDVDFHRIPVAGKQLPLNIINPRLLSAVDPTPFVPMVVYPNPVGRWLQVDCPVPINLIEVWDAAGRLLFSQRQPDGNRPLSLPQLPPGLLFLRVYTEKGVIARKILRLED